VRQGQGKNAYKDYKGQGDLNEISELEFAYFECVGVSAFAAFAWNWRIERCGLRRIELRHIDSYRMPR